MSLKLAKLISHGILSFTCLCLFNLSKDFTPKYILPSCPADPTETNKQSKCVYASKA